MKVTIVAAFFFLGLPILYSEEAVPDGFVLQVLEPTGGKIIRPKDWFYAERHGGPSYTWIKPRSGIPIQTPSIG